MSISVRAWLLGLVAGIALVAPGSAWAVKLSPGDLLVADPVSVNVILIDPLTGQQTAVSNNAINTGVDHFANPVGIALDADAHILVTDTNSQPGASGAVIRVDPVSGQQTAVSTNAINTGADLFVNPEGIALDANGSILVTDLDTLPDNSGAVIRVDPVTGQQTAVSTNAINPGTDLLSDPYGITLDAQGQILLADGDSPGPPGTGAVIRVDPVTGQQTAVSNNAINTGTDLFDDPNGIAFDNGGQILIADSGSQADGSGAVIRVDPASGQQQAVSTNAINPGTDLFQGPLGLVTDAEGSILVSDFASQADLTGAVIRVDPVSGLQTAVSTNTINTGTDLFGGPFTIAVVPPSVAKCGGKQATIAGDARANAIKGTPGGDVIVGLGGKDVIRGLRGKDTICGGKGRDKLLGGKGRDKLIGGPGRDKLVGGRSKDKLVGGPGRDSVSQ